VQYLKFASQSATGTTADVRMHALRSQLMTKTVAISGTTAATVATITLDPYKSVFLEVRAVASPPRVPSVCLQAPSAPQERLSVACCVALRFGGCGASLLFRRDSSRTKHNQVRDDSPPSRHLIAVGRGHEESRGVSPA
jgi:hypothetical protein